MILLKRGFLLLPVMAAMAWAQDAPPAAAQSSTDPEAALRARAQEFFQLQVEKKYRPAEAMVADDTKDLYYDGRKFNISAFTIEKIEMRDSKDHATITIKAKVRKALPGAGIVDFETVTPTLWKVENGEWRYYIDQSAEANSPFGKFNPGKTDGGAATPKAISAQIDAVSSLDNAVQADRKSVNLKAGGPEETVTITNELPGGVDLDLETTKIEGLKAELEKRHLGANEKTVLHLHATGSNAGSGVARISVSPLGTQLEVRFTIE